MDKSNRKETHSPKTAKRYRFHGPARHFRVVSSNSEQPPIISDRTKSLVYEPINWDTAPTVELYEKQHFRFEANREVETTVTALKSEPVDENDFLKHTTKMLPELRDQYRDAGFATKVVLQDPRSHRGPTTACTIGFPTNLPRELWNERLRLFKRFVCRVHVDITTAKDGYLWSKPHVEPDPVFHWKEHIEYSTIKHLDIRGQPAVRILSYFLDL